MGGISEETTGMEIGVDATCWHNPRGYGRHARALLSALLQLDTQNRYTFFLDSSEGLETLPAQAGVRVVEASVCTVTAASSTGHRSLRDMWRMSRAMSDPTLDLLLFPTVYSFVPIFSRAKKVVIIHDVIAELYPHLTLPSPLAKLFWDAKVAVGRWQADAIVTVSEFSRQGILERFKIAGDRVFVVGEASDPVFRVIDDPQPTPALVSLGLTRPVGRIVVYVGGFGPHKNLETLVTVFGNLVTRPSFSDVRLVMVGEYRQETFHSNFEVIRGLVEQRTLEDRVIFAGYLPDIDLVALLNLSTLLVLPSLIEGFGLPAMEAAACGVPVIATMASPLPTLLGGGGLYIDPTKPDELEMTLLRVLESPSLRTQMRQAGLAAAKQLTWESAAGQLLSLFQQVMAS